MSAALLTDRNTAAERQHDARESAAPNPEPHMADALEQVVEQVMSGLCVPKHGATRIDLDAFLDQKVPMADQTEDFISLLTCSGARLEEVRDRIKTRIETELRSYLAGSPIVLDVARDLAEQARADRED